MSSAKYVILGGGMVAGYAAKELAARQLRPGELTIISAEAALPYERPPLSKGFLAGKETESGILINSAEWYREQGIEVRLDTTVENVNLKDRRLRTTSGEIAFENLLIATGARSRKLTCPGSQLANVFYLRSVRDSQAIRARAAGVKRAVVIGGGFIGMEVSSILAQKNIAATMVVREDRVWSRAFTPAMSEFFERYYAARGVEIVKGADVAALEGKDGVASVALKGGKNVSCDMVVAGVGAEPVTEIFADSGISIGDGIVVNEYLETAVAGVYAAGDVANYPDAIFEKRRRVEHWDNAVSQGQHWAGVVRSERQPFVHVPYFFSDVFDLSYELWGDSSGATEAVVRGEMEKSSFSVWWLKNSRLIAAFTMNRPDEEREAAPEWIMNKRSLSAKELANPAAAIRGAVR